MAEVSAVREMTYHTRRATWARLDLLPFVLVESVLVAAACTAVERFEFICVAVAITVFSHAIAVLTTFWSVGCCTFFTLSSVPEAAAATVVRCVPTDPRGIVALCDVQLVPQRQFEYQKLKFIYRPEQDLFTPLSYPSALTSDEYKQYTGLDSQTVEERQKEFGKNFFDVPVPTFKGLMKQHAVAPFFVFQMFCVVLWCLDEYWYYAVFTAIMLVVFEATVVYSRLRSLQELRGMIAAPVAIQVFRNKKWTVLSSDELVPGDVCCINRNSFDETCPCDMVMLRGSCIANESLLTGETLPQLKESLWSVDEPQEDVSRRHRVFGGSKIMVANRDETAKPKLPGVMCVVTSTGFATQQGQLMRTILFGREAMTASSSEAFMFIGCLLCFAIVAAWHVLQKGLEQDRSRYKLVLNCIMIVTSVVPPELPMELSLAVNNSLQALQRMRVACTEPFRIPLAGKVDTCCFDKTGTLTSDFLTMRGMVLTDAQAQCEVVAGSSESVITTPQNLPLEVSAAVGGCTALVVIEDEVVGDAMERAALESLGWNLSHSGEQMVCYEHAGPAVRLDVHKRHAFDAVRKRMSTVVTVGNGIGALVTAKGAPEGMKALFESVPDHYDTTHQQLARAGLRVLAVGSKSISVSRQSELKSIGLDQAESGLTFLGFACFDCPIKRDSCQTIKNLLRSSHDVLMITGDHLLTATSVARTTGIVSKDTLNLTLQKDNQWVWQSDEGSADITAIEIDDSEAKKIGNNFDLCVGGDGLSNLQQKGLLEKWVPYIKVFARTTPKQKEDIVNALRCTGRESLMCGDGTNDVGALKAAAVGVALVDVNEVATSAMKNREQQQQLTQDRVKAAKKKGPEGMMEELNKLQEEERRATQIHFGDASIAAPFTAKTAKVSSCVDVIRQGRCTLITTLQMYKILSLNCLVSAWCLSVLYMDGLKWGDTQMTLQGIQIAAFFFFISLAKPAKQLSERRPPSEVFCLYIISSIVMQVLIHLWVLIQAVELATTHVQWDRDNRLALFMCSKHHLDAEFSPSIFNTIVYLISSHISLTVFAVNYQGKPHMWSLMQNKLLCNGLMLSTALNLVMISGIAPFVNEMFELVPIPVDLMLSVVQLMAIDVGGTLMVEAVADKLFNHGAKRF